MDVCLPGSLEAWKQFKLSIAYVLYSVCIFRILFLYSWCQMTAITNPEVTVIINNLYQNLAVSVCFLIAEDNNDFFKNLFDYYFLDV